jgi:serine/threonine protein kinase/tetratricopeptide (TPR) repeat protein
MADSQPVAPNLSQTSEFLPGTVIGRFRIGDRLGKGGMGDVYRAEDTKLKRQVALKRLAPELRADAIYRHRFLEEAERASRFSDAHVAALYDVLEENGEMFLVMEYVEGETLRQRLRRPMSLEEFFAIATQCAEALSAAHDRGIVHCDIKPENIMLTSTGQVKVLDFGVAKHLPRSDQSSTVDRSGTMAGTPAYMSPEVLLEKAPDGRADVFSLGVVFYEALTGHHPFLASSFVATTDRIRTETPAPIRIFNSNVPEGLEALVGKAMAKEPEQRYASARDLLEDLRLVQAGLTPTKLSPVLPHPAPGRRWIWIAASVALITVLLFVVVYRQLQLRRGPPQSGSSIPAQLAVLPFASTGNDPAAKAFCDGLTETLTAKLTQLTGNYPLQVVPTSEVRAEGVTSVEQARRDFGVNLVLVGNLHESGGQMRVTYSLVDAQSRRQLHADTITADSTDTFAVEDQVVDSVLGMLGLMVEAKDRSELAVHGTHDPAAYDFYLRGRGYLQDAHKPENVESAIIVFNHALERDANYALAYAGLGEAYWARYEQTQDQQWVGKAATACRRAASLAPRLANGFSCFGTVYNGTGRYEEAVEQFRLATDIDPTSEAAFMGLATAYQRLGKLNEAEATYRRAIDVRPQYWGVYNQLGKFYYAQARYDDAAKMFSQVVALAPDSYRGYSNLGGVYLAQGRYSEAVPLFERSASIRPTSFAYSNLATGYFYEQRFADAARTYEQAVKLEESDYVVWGNLAESYYWAPGERAHSAQIYAKAIALAEGSLRVNPRDTVVLYHLALFNAMLQHRAKALAYLQRAMAVTPQDPELWFKAAKVYTQLGQTGDALAALEKAVAEGYTSFWVRDDPIFANLASDVRFQKLRPKQ